MTDEFKVRMIRPSQNVTLVTSVEVVQAQHFMPVCHQPVDEMGTNKTSTACNQNSHSFVNGYQCSKQWTRNGDSTNTPLAYGQNLLPGGKRSICNPEAA
jgi:hypothetical protein